MEFFEFLEFVDLSNFLYHLCSFSPFFPEELKTKLQTPTYFSVCFLRIISEKNQSKIIKIKKINIDKIL